MAYPKGHEAINHLIDQGWCIDHSALVREYRCAGTISPMHPRGGYEYCRVHHGHCVTRWCYQETTVLRRKL